MAGGITSIGLPGAALGAGIGGSAVASLLTVAAIAVLALALGAGLVIFAIECVRASRRPTPGLRLDPRCPWPTADEVDDLRRKGAL